MLVVDDDPSFRYWARALLEASGYDVVDDASDGESGLAEAARLRPQVVLIDIQLPDMSGFEVARRLSETEWRPAVVLISGRGRYQYGDRVRNCGALGFIAKEHLSEDAIVAVVRGRGERRA